MKKKESVQYSVTFIWLMAIKASADPLITEGDGRAMAHYVLVHQYLSTELNTIENTLKELLQHH